MHDTDFKQFVDTTRPMSARGRKAIGRGPKREHGCVNGWIYMDAVVSRNLNTFWRRDLNDMNEFSGRAPLFWCQLRFVNWAEKDWYYLTGT
ncbi:hypothetical protein CEXT_106241 [Caerostris extrusa]|uniref:Uncharacterized protein n=1 Tax=Caerostris extrusa TaxID=172846 RepID=A0AAV4T5L5_CAEEX|nr:hypothetical protein CEXT_106241 [Caerostris extrusa]